MAVAMLVEALGLAWLAFRIGSVFVFDFQAVENS
jgi:hypothetical protein